MSDATPEIRTIYTVVEETLKDGARVLDTPTRKAAISGMAGEREHCAALMHPALGKPIRANVGGGKALLPSAKKLGGPGTAIDLPLGHKNAAFVRSHFDAMEVRIPDAPRDDELVLMVGVTDSGRPAPRVGGLTVDEVKGEDGLR